MINKSKISISEEVHRLKRNIKITTLLMIVLYYILYNFSSNNGSNIILKIVYMSTIGIITSLGITICKTIKNDKKIYILFRGISSLIISLGLLFMSRHIIYIFYKGKNIPYVYLGMVIYIILIIYNVIFFIKSLKDKTAYISKKVKIGLLGIDISFWAAMIFFLLGPLIGEEINRSIKCNLISAMLMYYSYFTLSNTQNFLANYIISRKNH